MAFDPLATAGLVTREVRTGSRDGGPTRIVVARRTYATDQADLWDAVTNGERLPRWFVPVHGELEIGGRYQVEGNASGTIEECEAPHRFATTWEFMGSISWLEVTLTAAAGGTTIELRHEAPVEPEFWEQYGAGATGVGWDLALLGLGFHIDGAGPVDPTEADQFATTPDGTAFVEAAASGWAEASIADGDNDDDARQAAARTVTFYTVAPEAVDSPTPAED